MPLVDPVTMSSSIVKGAVAQPAQSAPKAKDGASSSTPALQPIHIKQTAAAQASRHVFPVLLVAIFAVRFKSLIADPVSSMYSTYPMIVALQFAYALVCLPAAGSQSSKPGRKPRPGEKRKSSDGTGSSATVTALLSLVLAVLVTPFFYAIMVLFGAPFLTHSSHTLLCAAHLAFLTLFPLFYVHGVDSAAWVAIGGFQAPFDETFGGLVGGILGAWLGAVPIPLDWDREWQKWPITILVGAYGGYVLGRAIGGSIAFGKKF